MHSHCVPGIVLTFSCISAHLIFITTLGVRCYGSHIIWEKLRPEGINKKNVAAGSRDAGPRGLLPAGVPEHEPHASSHTVSLAAPTQNSQCLRSAEMGSPDGTPCKVCFLGMRVTGATWRPREAKPDSLISSRGSSCYGGWVSEGTDDRKELSEEKNLKNKKR